MKFLPLQFPYLAAGVAAALYLVAAVLPALAQTAWLSQREGDVVVGFEILGDESVGGVVSSAEIRSNPV